MNTSDLLNGIHFLRGKGINPTKHRIIVTTTRLFNKKNKLSTN
jgi:hypothetical protein